MENREDYKKREKFFEKYRKEHYCCPKCHSKNYSTTLAGYILIPGKEDEYKDMNSVECISCGWKGIFHSLAPKPEKTGFKVGVVDFSQGKEQFSEYDGVVYTEKKAKALAERLENLGDTDKKMYYAFEVEVK
jgi:hypothetical protein